MAVAEGQGWPVTVAPEFRPDRYEIAVPAERLPELPPDRPDRDGRATGRVSGPCKKEKFPNYVRCCISTKSSSPKESNVVEPPLHSRIVTERKNRPLRISSNQTRKKTQRGGERDTGELLGRMPNNPPESRGKTGGGTGMSRPRLSEQPIDVSNADIYMFPCA